MIQNTANLGNNDVSSAQNVNDTNETAVTDELQQIALPASLYANDIRK